MELAADRWPCASQAWDEEAVWSCCLSGDGDAFGRLFDRHRDRVFGHARRMAFTRHDAEDIAASAFLELWRRRGEVRVVDGSVLPWLLVTTTNLGRNAKRGTRRYRRVLERLPRPAEQPDSTEESALGGALGVDPDLAAGLRALSRLDANLFVLVALEGLSASAAAVALGLTESAARARLHRARSTLKACLSDSFAHGEESTKR